MNERMQLTKLNDFQKKAVLHNDGHLLIVAGPGTGKTHTLTYRIAHKVSDLSLEEKILAITFTNKAAEEMRVRLESLLADQTSKVVVATFHQFCLNFLSDHKVEAGLDEDFSVADEDQILEFAKELWPDHPQRQRKNILNEISLYKSVHFQKEASEDAQRYNSFLKQRACIDFDDLLLRVFHLLQSHTELRQKLHQIFRYVFVDEYQDVNPIQHSLLKILVGLYTQLTAIGDPNQAIYGFRGSSVHCFESFQQDFRGAETIKLSTNYRSAKNILSASGQVIAGGGSGYLSDLTGEIALQGRLTIHATANPESEARYVAREIERLIGGSGMDAHDFGRVQTDQDAEYSYGDIVILYRLKSQAHAFKKVFDDQLVNIPYHIVGQNKPDDEDEVCPVRNQAISLKAEKVSLMSIHASKGLEFPVVFIVGCEKTILPLDLADMVSDVEEERRLFYVGMTRAKERLYLLRAKERFLYGKKYQNDVSVFLSDIEEELKEYERMMHSKKKKKKEIQPTLF